MKQTLKTENWWKQKKKCTIYVATGLHDYRCNLADTSYIRRYLLKIKIKTPWDYISLAFWILKLCCLLTCIYCKYPSQTWYMYICSTIVIRKFNILNLLSFGIHVSFCVRCGGDVFKGATDKSILNTLYHIMPCYNGRKIQIPYLVYPMKIQTFSRNVKYNFNKSTYFLVLYFLV